MKQVTYLPASGPTPSLMFQEHQHDTRVERKRGSEAQRLAERYREDRSSVVCSLRRLGMRLKEALSS